jgi:hypothetical protein
VTGSRPGSGAADEPVPDAAPSGDGDGGPRSSRARQRKSMLLRLDPAVHEALSRWAGDELRSTNAHVEWLLRRALQQVGRLPPD